MDCHLTSTRIKFKTLRGCVRKRNFFCGSFFFFVDRGETFFLLQNLREINNNCVQQLKFFREIIFSNLRNYISCNQFFSTKLLEAIPWKNVSDAYLFFTFVYLLTRNFNTKKVKGHSIHQYVLILTSHNSTSNHFVRQK